MTAKATIELLFYLQQQLSGGLTIGCEREIVKIVKNCQSCQKLSQSLHFDGQIQKMQSYSFPILVGRGAGDKPHQRLRGHQF